MFLGGVIWIGSYELDPFRPLPSKTPPVEVQVVSLDWKWLFIYPRQGIATVNQLVVPAGTPVHFSITSASVFNVFFIPRLGSMIYAMPGMVSQLYLQADRPAVLFGQSAQFSGDGFSDMRFQVQSVPPAQFAAWAQSARGGRAGARPGRLCALAAAEPEREAVHLRGVDPQLFQAIATPADPARARARSPRTPRTPGARSPPAGGTDRCSASSTGRPSRSTSRSR